VAELLPNEDVARRERVLRLREQVGTKLDEISRLYRDRVKCTLIVRAIDFPDGKRDTVMTDEDGDGIENAIAGLRRLLADPTAEHYDDMSALEQGHD
jgi:hypothetical protein